MLEIKVKTENGQTHTRVSGEMLSGLVHRIGGEQDRFLVVQRIPDQPGFFVQAWHEQGAHYQLEYRAGDAESHLRVSLGAPDPVAEVMVRWARQEPDWDAGINWESAGIPAQEPVPDLLPDVLEELQAEVRTWLRCGYGTVQTLTEDAEEYLVKDGVRPVTAAQARQLVERLWLERVEEQSRWTDVTGPDLLEQAFTALDACGITAREHFTCCRSCGLSEIYAAGDEAARGFVFFHMQGTRSVAQGHGLTLHYGGFDSSEETTAAVGREVSAALADAGLPVEWNGSPDTSIALPGIDWRKRLVG